MILAIPNPIQGTQGELIWLWVNLVTGIAYIVIAHRLITWFKGRDLLGAQFIAYMGSVALALNGIQRIVWAQYFNDYIGGLDLLILDAVICVAAVMTASTLVAHDRAIRDTVDYLTNLVKQLRTPDETP